PSKASSTRASRMLSSRPAAPAQPSPTRESPVESSPPAPPSKNKAPPPYSPHPRDKSDDRSHYACEPRRCPEIIPARERRAQTKIDIRSKSPPSPPGPQSKR